MTNVIITPVHDGYQSVYEYDDDGELISIGMDEVKTNQASCTDKQFCASLDAKIEHLDRYNGKEGFFIKKFLISDKFNLNRWRVSWDAIKKDLETFIGQPVVLTPDGDHPAVAEQDDYKVGVIVDTQRDDMTHEAWAIEQITDKTTQQLILDKKVRYGSPTVHTPMNKVKVENEGTASEQETLNRFIGKHDALVNVPAYGEFKDVIRAVCEGDGKDCATELHEVQA